MQDKKQINIKSSGYALDSALTVMKGKEKEKQTST